MHRRLIGSLLLIAMIILLVLMLPQPASDSLNAPPFCDSTSLGLMLLEDSAGVYVLAVSEESLAQVAGLEPGDYILSAGGGQLTSTAAFNSLLLQEQEELQLRIRRQNRELLLSLPLR